MSAKGTLNTARTAAFLALGLAQPLPARAHSGIYPLASSTSEEASWDEPRALYALPILRVNLGGAFLLTPATETHFALDVHGGALIGWPNGQGLFGRPSAWLFPEAGYSLRLNSDGASTHLGTLGLGAGYGVLAAMVVYTPRFVVGKTGDETTIGFRQGISGHLLLTLLSLELSHQVLSTANVISHELLFTVGLNPASLLFRVSRL